MARSFPFLGTLVAIALWTARDVIALGPRGGLVAASAVALGLVPLLAADAALSRLPIRRSAGGAFRAVSLAIVAAPLAAWAGYRAFMVYPAPIAWTFPGAVVMLAAIAIAAARFGPSVGAPSARRYWLGALVYGAALDALFVWVHETEGTLAAIRPGTEGLHVALFAATAAGTMGLALAAGVRPWLTATEPPPRARRRLVLAGALVAVGLAALEADRRALVDLYPAVHTWLGVAGIVALDTGLRAALSCADRRAFRVAGPVAAALFGALALAFVPARGLAKKPAVRSAISAIPQGWLAMRLLPNATQSFTIHPEVVKLLDHPRYLDQLAPANDYNVLLVTVDTLRGDMIGSPRKPVAATPRLSAFAGTAVSFERAYAQGPRTSLAMSTLFLGKYSASIDWKLHIYKGGKITDPDALGDGEVAPTRGFTYTTLPDMPEGSMLGERMKAAGLFTIGLPFAGKNRFFSRGSGFDHGFDVYEDLSEVISWEPPSSAAVTERALRELDAAKGKRFFQWIHYYDPHESKHSRAKYDELCTSFDAAFGALLDGLRERGLEGNTAIFLLADHGEALGEHGAGGHASSLYDEQIQIPFIARIPGVVPREERRPVAAIDAHATMVALVRGDTSGLDGVNLLPLILRREYPKSRPVFSELHRYYASSGVRTADLKAVVMDEWKLIYNRKNDTWLLFDVVKDVDERKNRVATAPEYQEMRKVLETFLAKVEKQHPLP